MLDELLTELSSTVLTRELDKMKTAEPEKYDQTLKMLLSANEVLIHFLRESPEFRQAFARIHSEFLKYPECKPTIDQAVQAVRDYGAD